MGAPPVLIFSNDLSLHRVCALFLEVNYAERNTKRIYRNNSVFFAIVIYGIWGVVMVPTLEQEFEKYKAKHKLRILRTKILQYFKDIEDGQINVPDFMRIGQRPEDLADKALKELILHDNNLAMFNRLYEIAYNELSERL